MVYKNKKHELYTVHKHKIALNKDNGKRLVQADDIKRPAGGYIA